MITLKIRQAKRRDFAEKKMTRRELTTLRVCHWQTLGEILGAHISHLLALQSPSS